MVAVEVRALLRGDDTLTDGGHGGGIAREKAADFEGDRVLLLGEKSLTERLAQKGEDAVIDQEEVKSCFMRGEGGKEGGGGDCEGRTEEGKDKKKCDRDVFPQSR